MIDLRKHFNRSVEAQKPGTDYDQIMAHVSSALLGIMNELDDYGFDVKLDERNTVIKYSKGCLDVAPRLIIRSDKRMPADNNDIPDYVDFTLRARVVSVKQGALSALGLGKDVEKLNVYLPHIDPKSGNFASIDVTSDQGINLAAAYIVGRYADNMTKNDMTRDIKERVSEHQGPKTRRPGDTIGWLPRS